MKKQKRNKIIAIASCSFLMAMTLVGYIVYLDLSKCQEGIQEPFSESVPFVTQTFDVKDGFELHQTSGTHISIPKNAFMDDKGNVVKGKVEIKFREFHTAESILFSGIPMQMIDNRDSYMESLGMMELRVFQNGNELSLNKGKSIQVDLATTGVSNSDFKLYFLEDDKQWLETGNFSTVNNDRRDSAFANLPAIPDMPNSPKADSTDIVFVLDGSHSISPHLKSFKGVEWKLIPSQNEPIPFWAFRLNWDKVKINPIKESNGEFELTFEFKQKNYKDKIIKQSITIKAKPILTGKELKLAMKSYEEEYAKYEVMLAKIEMEEERLEQESSVLNRFSMNNLGIFNIDVLKNLESYAKIELEFDFESTVSPVFNKIIVLMVMEDINSVVKYNAFDWDDVSVSNTSIELIMVLPGGIVARVSPEEFSKKVNSKTTSQHFTNKFYFNTEKIPVDDFIKSRTLENKTKPRFI
jgi:hypothetical protein